MAPGKNLKSDARVRQNHVEVESYVLRAMRACGPDGIFSETKAFLAAALQAVGKVANRRDRNLASQRAAEDGKRKYAEWWEMLKKNAATNAEFDSAGRDPEVD